MFKHYLKAGLPHILALIFLLALSLIYFSPVLEGYKLRQGDITNFLGMSKEINDFRMLFDSEPLWTESMFGGMPAYQISVKYPYNILDGLQSVVMLGLPRPINFVWLYLAGFYLLLVSLRIKPWFAVCGAIAFGFASYYFIILEAGHNTKAHAIGYMAPILAGIVYAYRGKVLLGAALTGLFLALQIEANHVQITYYFGFVVLAWIIATGIQRYRENQLVPFFKTSLWLGGAAVLALCANLNMLVSTARYTPFTTRGATELTLSADGQSNATNRTSGLDRDYVTQWSYGKGESFSLLFPNAKGGASGAIGNEPGLLAQVNPQLRQQIAQSNRYWGNQPFTSGPAYAGAVVIFLALLGMVYLKRPYKWALMAVILLTLALSWGKNYAALTDFFLDYVPGYNKFRAVTIILATTTFSLVLLAFLFVRKTQKNTEELANNWKPFAGVTGGLILLLAVFYGMPDTFFTFLSDQEITTYGQQAAGNGENAQFLSLYLDELEQVRITLFQSDILRSIVFILLTALLLFLYSRKTINLKVYAGVLAALILIDMWPVAKRYVNNEKAGGRYIQWEKTDRFTPAYPVSAADKAILEQELRTNPTLADSLTILANRLKEEMRKANGGKPLGSNADAITELGALNFLTHYRVLNLGNPFNDAGTSYYHKSIGGYHGAKLGRYQDLIEFHLNNEMTAVIDRLQSENSPEGIRRAFDSAPVLNMLNTRYLIYNPEAPPLFNPQAFGPAWLATSVKEVSTADDEILALSDTPLRSTAIVSTEFPLAFKYQNRLENDSSGAGSITLESFKPNKLTYRASLTQNAIAVFSEIYYPDGWTATVNGKEVPILRANYVLRALELEPGEHKIEFRFNPQVVYTTSYTSAAFSLLLILLTGISLWREGRLERD